TWSHTLDMQSGLGLFYNGNDPFNTRLSYGNSSYDRTHVFITSFLYEFPKPIKSNNALALLVNGWQWNGLATFQSGQPFNFYDFSGALAGQYYGNTVSIIDPIIGFQPGLSYKDVTLQGTTGVNAGKQYVDASKLYIPVVPANDPSLPAGDNVETLFSNASRNVFRGPFQARLDTSIAKTFRINERFNLRYSADFLNVTNHPSFDVPNVSTSLYSVSSGRVTVRGPSASAGYISHTLGSPRFIQMSLRLTF